MKSALNRIKNASDYESAANDILSHSDAYNIAELILPDQEKELFGTCAHIISRMPIDFIEENAVKLLSWFQDLNWPGVDQIFDSLCRLPKDVLTSALRRGFEEAQRVRDEEWAYNLKEEFAEYLEE